MVGRPAPLLLRLYGAAANLLGPLAYARVKSKLSAQGTPPARWPERIGYATLPRPEGRLVWFHAASVGESVSVLRLITRWAETSPDLHFLLTSGTATSADIVAARLPPRTRHQFAPLDTGPAMRRFLRHWHPDAAVLVESELWPQMLRATHSAGTPLALINARLSDRSSRNWRRAPRTARHLMETFQLIHCQDTRTADHLQALGLTRARPGTNLKSLAGALPYETDTRDAIARQIGLRPVWLAASTHPGEDEIMLAAHARLLTSQPDALLILVPRHPERGAALETLIADHRFDAARRAIGGQITSQTQVYLADTLGETGLWYALSPLTCLCGSFTRAGGHTPYEPALAGSAILHGPHYANFADAYPAFDASGAALEVQDAKSLAKSLDRLLADPQALRQMRETSIAVTESQQTALDQIIDDLSLSLGLST
ncbi:3-deoxy-D-manno-octulosonic acid transferase [uncultured Roseovarius sp.]|uniref:3-deoxy-D-manno-octulosonic acid transferase n=1 Tax=uncultured Roseovarius sp. TaxID=293344 RepID=UPI00260A50AC|nr:3-deoxy-D-manno-octulosonic acid transferase [uncultured Roseovarius sp.]